ncbi:MAG: acyl-CoA dehydrogenase family protein [Euzebyales bacterium]|nr:acyl-CoA dehydrogenase family protein [Euzebyales bacterium]
MSDVHLTDEQRQLLDLVGDVARERFAPRAAEDEAKSRFPRDALAHLGSLDLAGLPFGSEHGGGGQPYGVYLRVLEEVARAHVVVALSLSVHTLATWAVASYAGDALAAEVLPRLTAGEWLGAYCLSEEGSGSDAAALTTRAEREGEVYVLNGTKAWVTHAGEADCYVVMVRTGEHKSRGVSTLLVPADTPGISFPPRERKMGMAASPTGQVVFTDARVPVANRLGDEGEGFRIALAALDGGRLGIAACAVGLAQCALDHAVGYAGQRQQFGRPIGQFQGVAFMLADMATGVEAARALYREAAARRDAGEPHGQHASMAKLFATDTAMRVTTDAVQVYGGYGYTTDYPVERLMREAKVMQIFEGTNQIQRVVISRGLLGSCSAATTA